MKTLIRASSICIVFVAVTGQAPPAAPTVEASQNFCARLGKNMGLSGSKLAESGWEANALNFGQRFLIGGTAATSVNVEPVEHASVEDYKRAGELCKAEGKGAVCLLTGPVNFEFGWKGNKTVTTVFPHENAVVRVEGIKAICQSDASGSKS